MADRTNHLERYADLSPRDQALADMEWDRSAEGWLAKQARGFGAGAINPFGLTGWGARGLAYVAPNVLSPETAVRFQEGLNRADADAPYMSAVGAMAAPGYAWLRSPARMPFGAGMTNTEALGAMPYLLGAVGAARVLWDIMKNPEERRNEMQRAREYGAAGY